MFGTSVNRSLGVLVLAALIFMAFRPAAAETAQEMLYEYFDLVVSGNYESARQYWTEESQRRASRFGIEYIDIPLKIDCSSPIVRMPDILYGYEQRPISTETDLPFPNVRRYAFDIIKTEGRYRHYYHVLSEGDYHWLLFPQDLWSKDWPVIETRYFRIHAHPRLENYLNPIVLEQTDRFVETTAKAIGMPGDALKLLEREKLDYFYCISDNMVKDLTGILVKGTYDLASDDIVSAFFPHYHEITHFLVNLKLRRLYLYTQPIFREGVAVHFGGRWGKTPTALYALGSYVYRAGVVDFESILTMAQFERSAGADLGYPLAGMFVSYIFKNYDRKTLFDLYRKLSGSFSDLEAMTSDDVRGVIVETLGAVSWDQLKADFDKYLDDWLSRDAGMYPGKFDGGKTILESDWITIERKDDWLSVTAAFPPGTNPAGNVLFGHDDRLDGMKSSLFDEQYKESEPFEGYRYGIRFDRNEAGIYDYATSEILAKYIVGFAPSENYYNEAQNTVTFRFQTDLTGGKQPSNEDHKLLSH